MAKLRVFYNSKSNMLIATGEKTATVTYRRTPTPYKAGMEYYNEMLNIKDTTQKAVEVYPHEQPAEELPLGKPDADQDDDTTEPKEKEADEK
jgi:hypothetical protein